MKFSYFALAAAAAVKAAPFDYDYDFQESPSPLEDALMSAIDEIVSQVFQETENGYVIDLQPYYYQSQEYTDNGVTTVSKWSFNGIDIDSQIVTLNWGDASVSGKIYQKGFFANNEIWSFLDPQAWDTWTIFKKDGKFEASWTDSSFEFDWAQKSVMDYTATNNASGSLSASYNEDDGENAVLNIQASKKIENFDMPEDFDLGMWADCDNELSVTSTANMAKCATFFDAPFEIADPTNQCVISNNYVANYKLEGEQDSGALNLEFSGKFIAAIATDSESDKVFGVVVRGENANHQGELIGNGNFYGVYMVGSAQYRQAVANGQSQLVIRVPGFSTVDNVLAPLVAEKMSVWVEFAENLFFNSDEIPSLFYYGNEVLANLDDEFDYSEVVAASHISSDLFGFSNERLVGIAEDLAEGLSEEIGDCEYVDMFYEEMHASVNYLVKDSQADYQKAFGSIF